MQQRHMSVVSQHDSAVRIADTSSQSRKRQIIMARILAAHGLPWAAMQMRYGSKLVWVCWQACVTGPPTRLKMETVGSPHMRPHEAGNGG